MTDLARLGIRIEAHGDRLRYSPRSVVTTALTDRMKAHKVELLAILRCNPEASAADELLEELDQRHRLRPDDAGRLVADGIPSDLADAVAYHEADLTRIRATEAAKIAAAMTKWQAALDRLEGDPLFPPGVMQALRARLASEEDAAIVFTST